MKKIILLFYIAGISAQRISAQSGITWSAPMDIASDTFGNLYPRITLDGQGNPLVIWGNSITNEAIFSRWNGSSFTTPISLNPVSIPVYTASWTGPDIASKGDTVYVVYKHFLYEINPSYLVRSFDGGINFSLPVQVDFIADSISWLPTITTDLGGNPLVAYMKLDPGFVNSRWVVAKSTDLGNTFSTDVLASGYSGGEVCDCCPGRIVSSFNKVAMLYRDNLSNIRDIWTGSSTDNANSFPNGINIDQNNWLISFCPASGPDGVIIDDTLYSVFMNGASGKNMVYTNKNSLSALASSTGNLITGDFPGLLQQNYPRIANYDSSVALVWKQSVSPGSQLGLFFTTNIHNGFPVTYDTVAAGNTGSYIINTDVAVSNGTIHVVWQDNVSGTVKYRKGTINSSSVLPYPDTPRPNLFIYPNPAHTQSITVQLSDNSPVEIEIFNSLGERITRVQNQNTIDISALSNGVYIFKAKQGNNSYFQKFVKL